MQNNLLMVPIALGSDWPCPSRSNLTSKSDLTKNASLHCWFWDWLASNFNHLTKIMQNCLVASLASIDAVRKASWIFFFFGGGGWGHFSKVVATFNHVGGLFIFLNPTKYTSLIPSVLIWGYVLHVKYVSCVITNCGQHQWVNHSLFLIGL